ncbi:NAD(P)-binding protein [Diplogelasinospora grovesii]|uniref:NAD(P)-binding protein n=1 Tax=Diplogelasinospora grovesii TaxID=303347 RepID=A0AAN6NEC6_9PEZI|nr:NAD(P)-binding protein [Diplogelasinospora grovesii]
MYNNFPPPTSPWTSPRAAVIDPMGYGKTAIITGCCSGIGLRTTQLLLAHQFQVCGLDQRDFDYRRLLREADQCRFHFHKGDLTEKGGCEEGVRICIATFGGTVDVLINVAGILDDFSSADTVTDEIWDRVLAVNLTVPVRMMRAVIPFMTQPTAVTYSDAFNNDSNSNTRDNDGIINGSGGGNGADYWRRGSSMGGFDSSDAIRRSTSSAGVSSGSKGGVIINVASAATSGDGVGVAYAASKHGLIGATKNVSSHFHGHNIPIRCNAVLPGSHIDSAVGHLIHDHDHEHHPPLPPTTTTTTSTKLDNNPHPHPPHPSASGGTITALEVAQTILFLVSDAAHAINGVCLPIDHPQQHQNAF